MPRLCLPVYVRVRAKLWFQRCVQNRYAVLLSTWVDGGSSSEWEELPMCVYVEGGGIADLDT